MAVALVEMLHWMRLEPDFGDSDSPQSRVTLDVFKLELVLACVKAVGLSTYSSTRSSANCGRFRRLIDTKIMQIQASCRTGRIIVQILRPCTHSRSQVRFIANEQDSSHRPRIFHARRPSHPCGSLRSLHVDVDIEFGKLLLGHPAGSQQWVHPLPLVTLHRDCPKLACGAL